jgi:hypothetical protein
MLYKKNVLVFRGSFRPITYAGVDILKSSYSLFKKDEDYDKLTTLPICEITMKNLLESGSFDERDFLDRVDLLNDIGQNVMVSNFREFYKLVDYLTQFRVIKLRLAIGILTFEKVLDEAYYSDLRGGLLEALGKLFPPNVKMYIYPSLDKENKEIFTIQNLKFPPETEYLFKHLVTNRMILDIPMANPKFMEIFSHMVLDRIHKRDSSWEDLVPNFIAKRIKERKLFGYEQS